MICCGSRRCWAKSASLGGLFYWVVRGLTMKTSRGFSIPNNTPKGPSAALVRQFVGLDLGTSGARISIIEPAFTTTDRSYKEVYTQAVLWNEGAYDDPKAWMEAVTSLLQSANDDFGLERVASICVSGTSSSCILVDAADGGKVTRSPARMYDYDVVTSSIHTPTQEPVYGVRALQKLQQFAPDKHTCQSPTSALAKLLSWNEEKPLTSSERLCHQSDYISMNLLSSNKACGSNHNNVQVYSDWHNCLKLGYDVRQLSWPPWLLDCLHDAGLAQSVLPFTVVSPGEPMGTISADAAKRFGLPEHTIVVGGTTDSNAAFFAATGIRTAPGTAVTSLGSTLAMKQLSDTYVEDASCGVYSHRFPSVLLNDTMREAWLVGGASNVGCAALRQQDFSNEDLVAISAKIDPFVDSNLSYYPLTKKGERFPIADSTKEPVLEPVPESRNEFLHGILQGIADVERDGFVILGSLGATPSRPTLVLTAGGGSKNDVWNQLRQRRLREAFGDDSLKVDKAENVEAGFGAAVLAAGAFF